MCGCNGGAKKAAPKPRSNGGKGGLINPLRKPGAPIAAPKPKSIPKK